MIYPNIDPVALQVGPLTIYWYGVTYLVGFLGIFGALFWRRDFVLPHWHSQDIGDLLVYSALGVIFGGRLGYLLFYDPGVLWEAPWQGLLFWERGRSFHGGLLGVLLGVFIFGYRHKRRFWAIMDFVAPAVPIGLGLGRLGNFINGELWGRVTDVPWAMVFLHVDSNPRHPSQLYELFLEGVLLFLFLWIYSAKRRAQGAVSGLFLFGYGVVRYVVEFYREPDWPCGILGFDSLTMGQLLSLPMIFIGAFIYCWAQWHKGKT